MGRCPDPETTEHRMKVWKELALRGVRVADIAERLRMTRVALDQLVYRQRKAGNPLAVYHADACFTDPNPSSRKLAKRLYARTRDRRHKRSRSARLTITDGI
jgi:hypothetical protein